MRPTDLDRPMISAESKRSNQKDHEPDLEEDPARGVFS
jgi:hypothetical protein